MKGVPKRDGSGQGTRANRRRGGCVLVRNKSRRPTTSVRLGRNRR